MTIKFSSVWLIFPPTSKGKTKWNKKLQQKQHTVKSSVLNLFLNSVAAENGGNLYKMTFVMEIIKWKTHCVGLFICIIAVEKLTFR